MNVAVDYLTNRASEAEITEHLLCCDADFVPTLSERVEIPSYAQKIVNKATRFEAWSNSTLVGLVAAYCNDQETRVAHITSVSVLKEWTGKHIAARLINQCVAHAKATGMRQIGLEVAPANIPAIKLYEKNGFVADKLSEPFFPMKLYLKAEKS